MFIKTSLYSWYVLCHPHKNGSLKCNAAENRIIIFDALFEIFIFYVFYYDLFFHTRPLGSAETISSSCQLLTAELDRFQIPLGMLFFSFILGVNNLLLVLSSQLVNKFYTLFCNIFLLFMVIIRQNIYIYSKRFYCFPLHWPTLANNMYELPQLSALANVAAK
jgi:hypothetical protein